MWLGPDATYNSICMDIGRFCFYNWFLYSLCFSRNVHPFFTVSQYLCSLIDYTMYVYKLFNALEDEKNVFKLHPKITSKRTARWARRHRKLRPPFFLRNRKSLRSQQHNDKQREKSADTRADNLIDFCDRSCYWKYLHSVGDSYAKTFESLCSIIQIR